MNSSSWLGRLGNLNVSRSQSRGPAPHKPLMLLTVIDLLEAGEIGLEGLVVYDVRIVARFRDYWDLVLDRQRNSPDIPMPFHARVRATACRRRVLLDFRGASISVGHGRLVFLFGDQSLG